MRYIDDVIAIEGCSATITLHPGTHTLGSQGALRLTGEGKQRWVGLRGPNGERAILSGGAQLTNWTEVVPGRWRAPLPSGAAAKTLRIGLERALQATFPNALAWPPKLKWFYVENFKKMNNNSSLSEVSVQEPSNLPREYHAWGNGTPGALVAYVFPASSWVGLRVEATPIQGSAGGFTLDCPQSLKGTGVDTHGSGTCAGLERGNRIAFAGALEILTSTSIHHTERSGVWAVSRGQVHVLSDSAPEDVWVPVLNPTIVSFDNKTNAEMVNVTFADASFEATGVQTGFNMLENEGCPHDGAVLISNSTNIDGEQVIRFQYARVLHVFMGFYQLIKN